MSVIAIVATQYGGGSFYHRLDNDKQAAAQEAARQFRADWANIFSIPKNHEFDVPVYDTTECPDDGTVFWDARGVFWHARGSDETHECPFIERVKVTA